MQQHSDGPLIVQRIVNHCAWPWVREHDLRSEKARCYLIDRISRNVGEEDRDFCRRVQRGLKTSEYRPGPLSQLEVCTAQFHEYLRERMAVVRAPRRPAPEVLREASRTAATER